MRVAVPIFGEDVSPRFGYSRQLLLAEVDERGVRTEGTQDLSAYPPWQWAELFASQGVAKVICGGMHPRFREELERRGIQVIWGVIGPVADALVAFQRGELQSDQFICPGRHGRRGHGGGRGRGMGHGAGGGRGGRRRGA